MDLITTAAQRSYTPSGTSIKHDITASLVAGERPGVVHITQYDQTLPIIAVRLMGNNVPYAVPAGAAVNFRARKPDGKYIYNPALGVSADGSTAYIAVTPQTAAASGKMRAVIEIVLNGAIAATASFAIEIAANPVPQDAIESTDEYKTIYDLLRETQAAADAANASKTAAAKSATAAAGSATAAQTSAGAAAASASTAGAHADNAQASAQAAAASKTAAESSETAAQNSAQVAAASATAAAASEDAARQYAETAKQVAQGAKGWYATESALATTHPTGKNGDWAIVGATDTIWVWDIDTGKWKDSGEKTDLSNYYTKTQTDAAISAGNAASAKKLATARTINGTAFDGTKDINTQYSYNFNGYSTAVAFIPFANIPNSGSMLNRNCSLLISGGDCFSTGVWPLFFVTFRWYNDFYIDVVAIKDTGDNVDIGYYTKSGRIYIALHAKQGYANYTMTVLGSATAGDLNLGFGTALTTQPSGWTVATKRVLQDAGQVAAATVDKARNVTGTVAIANGGTGATTAQNARSNLGALGDVLVGSYHGMTTASGSDSLYIRTTSKGILPYENNSTDGASQIGTSSWPFQAVYAKTFHGSATDSTARTTANAAMPKSGGTFTGDIAANSTNRAGAYLRNIYVQKDVTWEQVSTNSVLLVRK